MKKMTEDGLKTAYAGESQARVRTRASAAGGPISVRPICGFTMEGDAPGKCPICGRAHSTFVIF